MEEKTIVSIGELLKSNPKIDEEKRKNLKRALVVSECTTYFQLDNKSSKYEVTVGLAQGLDEDGVDSGYNQTTGLVVLGSNLPPGESARVDVSAMKVRATRAELSLDCKNKQTGEQIAIDLPDKNTNGEYPYMLRAIWELRD